MDAFTCKEKEKVALETKNKGHCREADELEDVAREMKPDPGGMVTETLKD
jgi:hypothetical protein